MREQGNYPAHFRNASLHEMFRTSRSCESGGEAEDAMSTFRVTGHNGQGGFSMEVEAASPEACLAFELVQEKIREYSEITIRRSPGTMQFTSPVGGAGGASYDPHVLTVTRR